MGREEMLTNLRVLTERGRTSPDHEVRAAATVLMSLQAALLSNTTMVLAGSAAEYSRVMIALDGR